MEDITRYKGVCPRCKSMDVEETDQFSGIGEIESTFEMKCLNCDYEFSIGTITILLKDEVV